MEAHGHVTAADVELPDASDDGPPEADVIDQEQATRGHGSESFFILGEGLVSTARGGREDTSALPAGATAAAAAQAPPFRFTRMRPEGRPHLARLAAEDREGDDRRRRDRLGDPVRLHVPRPVHRPRPDVRPDGRDARRGRVAGGAAPGPLAEPRPRLALRRRPAGTGLGEVLRGRRPAAEDGQDPGAAGRRAARDGFDLPRHRRTASTRSIPDFRNDENLAVAQTHLAFIRFHNRVVDSAPARCPRRSASPARGARWSSTTSGWSATTTCRGSATRRSSTTSSPTAASSSRSGPTRARSRRCRSSSPWPRSGSATAWSGRSTAGTRVRQRHGLAAAAVRLLRHERLPRAGLAAAQQLDRRLPAPLPLQARPAR